MAVDPLVSTVKPQPRSCNYRQRAVARYDIKHKFHKLAFYPEIRPIKH